MAVKASVVILAPQARAQQWSDALADSSDLEVIGATASVDAVDALVADDVPDVVLVDLATPSLDAVDLCRRLSDATPVARVLLVGGQLDAPVEAIAAGAAGTTSAAALAVDVGAIVQRVARGEGVVSQAWASSLVEHDDGPRFTATEREVLQRLAKGGSIESVAAAHEVPNHVVGLHAGYALAKVHRAATDARAERDAAVD
jgi:two-component system, NarL family, response regulator DevR